MSSIAFCFFIFFFFQAEDGIRDSSVTGVQTCALPISAAPIWLPDEAPGTDQARLQEPEAHHRDRGDQYVPRRLLGELRLQLVQRGVAAAPVAAGPAAVVNTSSCQDLVP